MLTCQTSHSGFIHSPNKLRDFYTSLDILITSSLDETFGLTIAESQLCSTPVVAFDSGAISEIILHKKTGYLSKLGDINDFIKGIIFCRDNLEDLSRASFLYAMENFKPSSISNKHLNIYSKLINNSP